MSGGFGRESRAQRLVCRSLEHCVCADSLFTPGCTLASLSIFKPFSDSPVPLLSSAACSSSALFPTRTVIQLFWQASAWLLHNQLFSCASPESRTGSYLKDRNRMVFMTFVTLEHKTSHKQHGYICSNSQKYIVWVKIIDFSFMPKIIRTLSKDHVPWRYFVNFHTVNI